MMSRQIEGLKREKQGALEAVVRFVQSMGLSGIGPGPGLSEGREETVDGGAAGAEKAEEGTGDIRPSRDVEE